jgi:hypothetical protein
VPNTTNYGFEYESPNSLPGTTITGGPGGGSPILAVQVDTALASVETKVDVNTANIATNTAGISANGTAITNLQNWTRRGTILINFTTVNTATAAVVFGFTFPAVPTIVTNIDSGAGATARWESRAISATTTGFTMFVYQSQANTGTWVDIPVSWIAHYD